ncbi:MAG: PD40 domain-containing protein [Flavobacteriales bacterium]|nr:PD40 domain-containing protein [Flavobacteriales bacterium]
MDKFLAILILFLGLQCSSQPTRNINLYIDNVVIYSVDKDGLYRYDLSTDKSIKITTLNEIFIDNSLTFINDSVVVIGYKGQIINEARDKVTGERLICPCSSTDSLIVRGLVGSYKYDRYTLYKQTYQAVNITNQKSWLYQTIDYEHKEMDTLTVTTTKFNFDGDIISIADTVYRCNNISYSSDGLTFCKPERFYSSSNSVKNKQVYSKKGNLYLRENNTETLILEYDGHFDPKFGSGYYQPTLSPDGNKVIFRYLAGFLKSGSGLFELDLKTMKKMKLTKDDYFHPTYSPDGRYLLIGKTQHQYKNDIYIFDLKTKKRKKIGKGALFTWRK